MGITDKLSLSGNDSVCTGEYGMVEDQNGNKVKGISMNCPDHDEDIVIKGELEEAKSEADSWLQERGKEARIRNRM